MAVSEMPKTSGDRRQVLLQIAILAAIFVPISGNATESDFLSLYTKLLGNYSRNMRPLINQSDTIEVALQFDLLSVSDLDDVKQRISALAAVSVQWTDKNLVWDPEEYGGIDRMYFDEDQIWAPKVYIEESQTKGPTLFNLPTTHMIFPNGEVNFVSSGILETSCSLDMTYFPYDYQSCRFGFGILDSSKRDAALVPSRVGPKKSSTYVEDGEWSVFDFGTEVNYYGEKNYEFQTLYVIMKLHRRPLYYVLNVIVPAVTVSLLSLLTFAVPVESGERLAYALTNLLSLAVYITYIGSIMPSSSVDLPIILRYLIALFLISSMCVVTTVVVIAVRWSRLIVVNDRFKSIFVCGFRITFKRRQVPFLSTKKEKPRRLGFGANPSLSMESTDISTSELHSLCDSPQDKMKVDNSNRDKNTNKKSVNLNYAQNDVKTPPAVEMKSSMGNEDIPKGFRDDCSEFEVMNAEMDPDIIYICSRIDIVSFSILLFSFLVMTIHSFAQLHQQVPV